MKGGALGIGCDLQGSTELFDFDIDHIHADPAPRHLGYVLGGAESGLEDILHQVRFAQLVALFKQT